MPAPADFGYLSRVIVRVIVFRDVNGQALVHITVILSFECKRIIFRVTRDEEMAPIFCADDVNTCLIGFGKDIQLADFFNVRSADFGVSGVWSNEYVIETAQQTLGRRKDAVFKDAEHLFREVIFWDSVTMIESGLCSPANIERRLYMHLSPVEYLGELVPVIHFFKMRLFYRGARDDKPIEFFIADIINGEIVI